MGDRHAKEISFFLTTEDEQAIAAAVVERLPSVRWVDSWHWERVDVPPVRESVLDCGKAIGIWPTDLIDPLRGVRRAANPTIDSPTMPGFVFWDRSVQVADQLQLGRWATWHDPSDKPMATFLRTLWKIMRDNTDNRLVRTSGDLSRGKPAMTRYHAGRNAWKQAAAGRLTLQADALTLTPQTDA